MHLRGIKKVEHVDFYKKNCIFFNRCFLFPPETECLFDIGHTGSWKGLSKSLTYRNIFMGPSDKSKIEIDFLLENFRNSQFSSFFIPRRPTGPGQNQFPLKL